MAKGLALIYPTHGHITPALAVVEELVRRGEEIVFYATGRSRARVEATAARFRAYEHGHDAFNPDPPTDGLLSDMARLLALTEAMLPRLLAEVAAERPDYLLIDTKSVWGRLVGQILGLPAITLSVVFAIEPGLVAVPDLVAMLHAGAPRERLLDGLRQLTRYADTARRLTARHDHAVAPDIVTFLGNPQPLNIIFTSRSFQLQGDRFGDAYAFVGTSIGRDRADAPAAAAAAAAPGPAGDASGPLVYVSLGTTFNHAPAFYRACFEAVDGQPYRVLLSTGGRDQDLPPSPANVDVQRFVPQMEVLARADAFVTHGGMNSANEALLRGVPMLVVPQRGDQFLVGARVAELGAGLTISPREVTPEGLRGAIGRLLAESSFRTRARALGDDLERAGGCARAADLILASLPRPVAA